MALVSLLSLVLSAQHLHELEHILVLVLLVDDDRQAGFLVVGVISGKEARFSQLN